MNATRAKVQRIERTGPMLDGGGDRAAHAPLGRPQAGQKFPLNKVPQRGHGQPTEPGGADDVGGVPAGAPHRGQKLPSNNAPQRKHAIPPRRGSRAI